MLPSHVDVLVVGAGISGIDMAWHLQTRCPGRSYLIVESRERIGGTWDLFRYPGIRSDSDMYTFGYRWRPWPNPKAIADGDSILAYLNDAVREHGIDRHIRFGHTVVRADWSSADARWTVHLERGPRREPATVTASFLMMCSGYYDYERGHSPQFPGRERFRGPVVHPQFWPQDLDVAGRRVVVIGSGATAVTLVPALADRGARVTMLQRSPTWILSRPAVDPLGRWLRPLLPARALHAVLRWKAVLLGRYFFDKCRSNPQGVGRWLLAQLRPLLPAGYDVARHFTPRYAPWTQRLCLVPDGDLFKAISDGRAQVVTDEAVGFTGTGVALRSGGELPADVIVTATGLELKFLGGVQVCLDGQPVDLTRRTPYRGAMLAGVPNLAFVFGYTNASWTLRADLVCEWVCRVLNHLQATGARRVEPGADLAPEATQPWVDFSSGYFQRALARFPKQGEHLPWKVEQDYVGEIPRLRRDPVDDGVLRFA
jgi:cation diffusion facilitator CzcD-associated flavoprotein CzcO